MTEKTNGREPTVDRKKSCCIHGGHRERMRERVLRDGSATLADHELVEMLLYYALPRRDTNETAHRLIEEFGSLAAVCEADRDRISLIEGISEHTSLYVTLLGELCRRYTVEKISDKAGSPVFDTAEKIAAFLAPRFLGLTEERAYLLLFDNGMRLLDCFPVGDGSPSGVMLSMRRIVERALAKRGVAAVFAHNHPGGLAVASKEDVQITHQLEAAMNLIEVPLLEHYIFSDRAYIPVLRKYDKQVKENCAASSLLDILQERLRKKDFGDRET